MPFCSNCGSEVDDNAKFCSQCGTRMTESTGGSDDSGAELSDNVLNRSHVDASNTSAPASVGGISVNIGGDDAGKRSEAEKTAPTEFCAVCGKVLSLPYRRCPQCGKLVCEEHFLEEKFMCLRCVQSASREDASDGDESAEEDGGPTEPGAALVVDVTDDPGDSTTEEPWREPGSEAGEEIAGPDGGTLVWVPPGSFRRGSTDGELNYAIDDLNADPDWVENEQPSTTVEMCGFQIGKYEVTNERYAAFLNETDADDVDNWLDMGSDYCGIEIARGRYRAKPGRGRHPVVVVNWWGAQAYCEHYGVKLPTEAQWEYAARGPESRIFPWGDTWDRNKCCNEDNLGDGHPSTMEIGNVPAGASWCGALDMVGNVWEWCADWYDSDYYVNAPGKNPPGPSSGSRRVLRGGSCISGSGLCRGAYREEDDFPVTCFDFIGFRVAAAVFLF